MNKGAKYKSLKKIAELHSKSKFLVMKAKEEIKKGKTELVELQSLLLGFPRSRKVITNENISDLKVRASLKSKSSLLIYPSKNAEQIAKFKAGTFPGQTF